jgi:two-component system cell cycle response regulator
MSVSSRLFFAICGAATSVAAPAGLVLLRFLSGSATSMPGELILNKFAFAYVSIASAVAVAAFGFAVGCRADMLRALATTDPLTGLLNRRAIEHRLRDESTRARRYGLPLSLLLVDLDGLKRVNDLRGHSEGDRVLREAATAIRCTLRTSDYGARWGGDEFLILAPHTSRQAAHRLAERIAWRIAKHPRSDRLTSTASIGVVTLEPSEQRTELALVDEADRALYAAKENGRSRIMAS